MNISNGIQNFLSTLSGYIDEEQIASYKNKSALEEIGISFLDPSTFENFNQFMPVDIETVKDELKEAFENLKNSEGGLSSVKEN
ncbi:hypothetical protein IJ425_02435, partial [bacterium]|nr:hypothetical protein [bacterium]